MRSNSLPILHTKHLILRPVTLEDADDIYEYAKNPALSKFLSWYPHSSIAATKELINDWIMNYKQNKGALWVLVAKDADKVIGTIAGIDTPREEGIHPYRRYLGYCLSAAYWGKGLMVEAINAVLAYLFSETAVTEVIAFVDVANGQSQRVLEKVGMHKEAQGSKREFVTGKWVELERWVIYKNKRVK